MVVEGFDLTVVRELMSFIGSFDCFYIVSRDISWLAFYGGGCQYYRKLDH